MDISPKEALKTAIQNNNPFSKAGIVKEQDVWGKGFPDVPTLNAHASDAVFQAIEQVCTSESSQDKVTSIAFTAQQGVGKSHIISRIRHRLEDKSNASFIYASVNNYADLNLIKYQFQQTLADSLSRTDNQGVMQWQEIAAAMANEGAKAIKAGRPSLSSPEWVRRFNDKSSAKKKKFINALSQKVYQTKPNADPYILQAILWTLSKSDEAYAVEWLSGKELDQSHAEYLGLPSNASKTSQDREAEAIETIKQILNLVSYYNPVVICFDEIDVENNCSDDGLTTPLIIADLVKRLYDTFSQSEVGKGVVILTVMLPDTWSKKINSLGGGTPDRVSTYTQRRPIELKYVGSDSMVELVTLWLQNFYSKNNLNPPHKTYPFEENKLREYGRSKPTVREALTWCAKIFYIKEKEKLPKKSLDRFKLALERESNQYIGDYLEDNDLIANSLSFGFYTIIGETLKGETSTGETLNEVTIEYIESEIAPNSKNKGYIDFKIIGKENNKAFKLGVAVLQHSHGHSVRAGIERLIDYQTFDLTRGCLVRSKEKKVLTRWKAYEYLNQLVQELGGEWAYLKAEEIRPLIDLYSVYQRRESYQLSEAQVWEYSKPISLENPLLQEILSNPSGKIDQEAIEEEQLLEDFLDSSSIQDTADEDDLSELFN